MSQVAGQAGTSHMNCGDDWTLQFRKLPITAPGARAADNHGCAKR